MVKLQSKLGLLSLVSLMGLSAHGTAQAQISGSVPAQNFSPSQPGVGGAMQLYDTQTLGDMRPGFGVLLNYSHESLRLTDGASDTDLYLLEKHFQVDFQGAFGIGENAQVGFILPISPQADEGSTTFMEAPAAYPGWGDLKFSGLYRFLGDGSGLDMAAAVALTLPTGKETSYLGDLGWTVEPRFVASYRLSDALRLRANLGFNYRSQTQSITVNQSDVFTVGSEVTYGVGGDYLISDDTAILAELVGKVGVVDTDGSVTPLELDLGARHFRPNGSALTFGVGAGLVGGYGSPTFRVFAGYGWGAKPAVDSDGDGLFDRDDNCPGSPEDFDFYQDDDGCPDLDNDSDGIEDALDNCPEGQEDGQGELPEDGCPAPDTDGDGIADHLDGCVDEPEDADGFEDEDGCIDPDNDKDGVLDGSDQCPEEKEVINGVDDDDGCPDEGESAVEVTETHIEIKQAIHFKTGSAEIMPKSMTIVKQIAQTLLAHPEITLAEVEGHTDNQGKKALNLTLSQNRADSVRAALIDLGVGGNRLTAVGYGESRPIAKNSTAKGRYRNRRVVIKIHEIDGKPVEE